MGGDVWPGMRLSDWVFGPDGWVSVDGVAASASEEMLLFEVQVLRGRVARLSAGLARYAFPGSDPSHVPAWVALVADAVQAGRGDQL